MKLSNRSYDMNVLENKEESNYDRRSYYEFN